MRKLFLAGAIGVFSTVAVANTPLVIQQGQPEPMGAPVAHKPAKTYQPNKAISDGRASLTIAYSGSKIGAEDLGGDSRLNGIHVGFDAIQNNLMAGVGFTYQNDSDWKYSEIHSKFGYYFLNQANSYGVASFGIGYAWMPAKEFPIDLEYLVLPIEVEVGHYIHNNLAVFGALGHKWLWNTVTEVCLGNFCGSDTLAEMDIDGFTYKLGIRYDF